MDVICEKKELLSGVQKVQRGVPTRTLLPHLTSVLLRAEQGMLELVTTDLEIEIRDKIESKIKEPGNVLIPAMVFRNIVYNLPESEVCLKKQSDESRLYLKCGEAEFYINTFKEEDFPLINIENERSAFSVERKSLGDTLKRTIKSSSKDEMKPVLNGALLSILDQKIEFVSTDSYRLTVCNVTYTNKDISGAQIIIPNRALQEVLKIISLAKEGEAKVSLTDNKIIFSLGNSLLTSRVIEGEFPAWEKLFPETWQNELKVNKKILQEIIRRVSVMAQDNAPVKMSLKKNEVIVSAEKAEVGSSTERCPLEYEGENMTISFNPTFLLDGLEGVDDEEVDIKINEPLKPCLIRPVAHEDYLYIIMPIKSD